MNFVNQRTKHVRILWFNSMPQGHCGAGLLWRGRYAHCGGHLRPFRPERLTVAGWMNFTGEDAPRESPAVEVPADALASQQEDEGWQMGPSPGTLVG